MSARMFTPGPWVAGQAFKEHHAVAALDGRYVALTGLIGAADEAESLANAGLIAEAPALLSALFRLSAAARTRDTTMGDACSLLAAQAELRSANAVAMTVIRRVLGDAR